jgi:hypothetical protein
LPVCGRNLLDAGSFGLIPGGKDEPVLHHPGLRLHEISWKRATFREINMRERRFGALSANERRECLARRLRFLVDNM